MSNKIVGADTTTGELPAVVEDRISATIDTKVLVETERATGVETGLDGRLDTAEGTLAALPATYVKPLQPSGDTTGVADTAAIQANEDAGRDTLLVAGQTYWVKGLVKKSYTRIYFNGATMQLPHAANDDVIIGQNFATLTDTATNGGIHDFGIHGPGFIHGSRFWATTVVPTTLSASFNMSASFTLQLSSTTDFAPTGVATVNTLSGPQTFTWSANDTGTGTLTCSSTKTGRVLIGSKIFRQGYGIRVYGYNFVISDDLMIHECLVDGLWTEWAPTIAVGSGTVEMESRVRDVKVYENSRNGYSYLGPHDSMVKNVVAFKNAHKGIITANASIGYFTQCHAWGSPQIIGIEDHTSSVWSDCVGEMTSASGSRGWGIWSNNVVTRGCIALWSGSGGNVGVEIENGATGCDIDMKYQGGFGNGALLLTSSGGNNVFTGTMSSLGANPAIAGTPHATDIIDLIPGGSTSTARYTQNVATKELLDAEAALARNADNLTSGTVADARIASTIARDSEVTTAVAAEATLARNGDNITSGTVADARIASTIARIASTISDGDTIHAPDGNSVFDALALKQPVFVAATTATASGTAAKTATVTGYTPATGDVLALTVTNGSNVAAPTLSINGGSALSIAIAGNTGSTASNMVVAANGVLLLYYSGSRWEAFGPQFSHGSMSQATAEAGTSANVEWVTALRIRQSVAAFAKAYANTWRHDYILHGTPNTMSTGTWTFAGYYGFSSAGSASTAYNSVWFFDIEPGTWSFDISALKSNNSGIITYEYSLDNSNWVSLASSVDMYNATLTNVVVAGATGVVISSQTRFYVRVSSAGTKNASSSAYYALVAALTARRTA